MSGSLLADNCLFFCMCILYYDSGILSRDFGRIIIHSSGAYVNLELDQGVIIVWTDNSILV
jgi:hypothetical protein